MTAALANSATPEKMPVRPDLLEQISDDWEQQLDELFRRHDSTTPGQRLALIDNLRGIWQRGKERLGPASWLKLANMAEYLCDWQLLVQVARRGIDHCGREHEEFHNHYIQACWQTADYQIAIAENIKALSLQPQYQRAQVRDQYMDLYLQVREQLCLTADERLHGDSLGLTLEPLAEHHAQSFLWCYLNSDIPRTTDLPAFKSIKHWTHWLLQEQFEGRKAFAILHHDRGFIGVACLMQIEDYGYFYYWIGEDFQGNGYGPAAVQMMLDHARQRLGLRSCYATIYDYNHSSIRAVKKMSFQALPLQLSAPTGTLQLFYCGPSVSPQQHREEVSSFTPKCAELQQIERAMA